MKDDFIELDFGEDEPESVKTPGTEKKNPVRKQGKFFVSYPKDKASTPDSENKSSHKETGKVLLRHTGEGKRYEALELKKITNSKKKNNRLLKEENTEFENDRMRTEEEITEPVADYKEAVTDTADLKVNHMDFPTEEAHGETYRDDVEANEVIIEAETDTVEVEVADSDADVAEVADSDADVAEVADSDADVAEVTDSDADVAEIADLDTDVAETEAGADEPKIHRTGLVINTREREPDSIEAVPDEYKGEVNSTKPQADATVPHGDELEIEVDFMEPEEVAPENINATELGELFPKHISVIESEDLFPEDMDDTELEDLLPEDMDDTELEDLLSESMDDAELEDMNEENLPESVQVRPIHIAEESEEDDFLEDIKELSDPELIDGFFGNVQEIPVPGAESLPDFQSGQIYGEPVGVSGDAGLSAIPKEREKIRWYLSLPFITLVLFVPIAGIIAGGVLVYLRYRKYHEDQQVNDLTTVYIILVICMILLMTGVYGIAHWVQQRGDDVKETVSGQSDREAAESQAREEAEEREKEELEAWLRTSAQADIGLEEVVIVTKEPSDESAEQEGSQAPEESQDGAEQNPGESAAESSGEDLESGEGSIEETHGFWESFLDKITGKTEEADQEYLDNIASDLQEFAISGDGCAQYSLIRLASNVTLFSAAYDDRFFEERYALFTFMQPYHGSQVDNKTFYLKSSLADMFSGTVHWDATLDRTQYRYLGVIADGVPQGMGVVLVPSNVNPGTYIPLYAGTFVNGTLEGYGMVFRENNGYFGITYEGYFSGGKYSGRGTIYEIPSSVNFQNRLSMTDAAGNRYTAEEVGGILNAYAAHYYNTMTSYQSENTLYACMDVPMVTPVITERGRYEKGKANGYCIRYGSFGIRQFAGIMKNNVRSGQGISYYANGRIQYDGEWKSGGYHGRGVLYNEDGSIWYEGEFANGDIKPVVQ